MHQTFPQKGATDASGRSHNLVERGSPIPDKGEHPNQARPQRVGHLLTTLAGEIVLSRRGLKETARP